MNTEIFILFLFLIFLFLLDKNKEGLKNPLIPSNFEFSVLTHPQEVMSGYNQEEICKNDNNWISGNKNCNHILDKNDCNLTNDSGTTANEACLISCDTCPSSVEIKFREDNEILDNTEENLDTDTDQGEDEGEPPSSYDILDMMDQIDKKMEKINLKFENSDLLISQYSEINEIEASLERLDYYNRQIGNTGNPALDQQQRERFLSTYRADRRIEIQEGMCEELANIIELSSGQNDSQIQDIIDTTNRHLGGLDYQCPMPTPIPSQSASQTDTDEVISQTADNLNMLEVDGMLSDYCLNLEDEVDNCNIVYGIDAAEEETGTQTINFNNQCKNSNSDIWSNCKRTCCDQRFIPLDAWRAGVYTREFWRERHSEDTPPSQYNSDSRLTYTQSIQN